MLVTYKFLFEWLIIFVMVVKLTCLSIDNISIFQEWISYYSNLFVECNWLYITQEQLVSNYVLHLILNQQKILKCLFQFAWIHASSLNNTEQILNRPITFKIYYIYSRTDLLLLLLEFHNCNDINGNVAELRITKTRLTSF